MNADTYVVDVKSVCERCAISRPTLYRLLKIGRFPAPFYPAGMKHPRWRSDDVTQWIESESARSAA